MSGPSDAAPLLLARPKRKASSTRNPVENAVTKVCGSCGCRSHSWTQTPWHCDPHSCVQPSAAQRRCAGLAA